MAAAGQARQGCAPTSVLLDEMATTWFPSARRRRLSDDGDGMMVLLVGGLAPR